MSKIKKASSYDGRQDGIPKLKTPSIETFKNVYPKNDYTIELEFPEFTAICPKTGLPDFGTIVITYVPNNDCLELKSLKEYFLFYRNIGVFHENVVNKTLDDLVKACKPKKMKVFADYNVRGGIHTVVERKYKSS